MNDQRIKTGVIHNRSLEWMHEDAFYHGIDTAYEYHRLNCSTCYREEGHCKELDYLETDMSDYLIGFTETDDPDEAWIKISGVYGETYYAPDEEAEYSAICREINTQIVRSTHAMLCAYCSPCYPDQGDLDTPRPDADESEALDYWHGLYRAPGAAIAYCPPPDVFGSLLTDEQRRAMRRLEGGNE